MDRNCFNSEVRQHLTEIPIGIQGIGFDHLEREAKSAQGTCRPRGRGSWGFIISDLLAFLFHGRFDAGDGFAGAWGSVFGWRANERVEP
jgi:hypothetical protein